jgi:uncharacterized protein YjcR
VTIVVSNIRGRDKQRANLAPSHTIKVFVQRQAMSRMHGGKGSGAPKGNRNAWKHGARSAGTLEALAPVRTLGRLLDEGS